MNNKIRSCKDITKRLSKKEKNKKLKITYKKI